VIELTSEDSRKETVAALEAVFENMKVVGATKNLLINQAPGGHGGDTPDELFTARNCIQLVADLKTN
jgi:hypothetical protein